MILESFFTCFFEFEFLTQTELFARALSNCFYFHKLYAGGNLQEEWAVHSILTSLIKFAIIFLLHAKYLLSILCVCVRVPSIYLKQIRIFQIFGILSRRFLHRYTLI